MRLRIIHLWVIIPIMWMFIDVIFGLSMAVVVILMMLHESFANSYREIINLQHRLINRYTKVMSIDTRMFIEGVSAKEFIKRANYMKKCMDQYPRSKK